MPPDSERPPLTGGLLFPFPAGPHERGAIAPFRRDCADALRARYSRVICVEEFPPLGRVVGKHRSTGLHSLPDVHQYRKPSRASLSASDPLSASSPEDPTAIYGRFS